MAAKAGLFTSARSRDRVEYISMEDAIRPSGLTGAESRSREGCSLDDARGGRGQERRNAGCRGFKRRIRVGSAGRQTARGRGNEILDRRLASQSSRYDKNGFLRDADWSVSA